MNDDADLALLPEGLHDDLPPTAGAEADAINTLIARFATYGYQRVKPPLIEFEESLLTGPGALLSRHMFRLMDPISQRMMAVRSDMTTQVARIATTRLKAQPRPLRLCYAGQVLRVRGTQLRVERQYAQAGVELIGAGSPQGDAEIVLLAADALTDVGVSGISIDLTVPSLVSLVCDASGMDGAAAAAVRHALDLRDSAALTALPDKVRQPLLGLLDAAGPAAPALAALEKLALPSTAARITAKLHAVVDLVQKAQPDLRLTIDPAESRGFEYQSGISFTLFAKGVRGELGRGGRYDLGKDESATGFTFYLDSVMRALPQSAPQRRLYLPFATAPETVRQYRRDGWVAVQGLEAEADAAAEARRLGCSHIYGDGAVKDL